ARGIQVAIVAVPAEAAQSVADQLVAAGIKAILNFAPARIKVPKDVRFKNVDLSIELETLSFYLAKSSRSRPGRGGQRSAGGVETTTRHTSADPVAWAPSRRTTLAAVTRERVPATPPACRRPTPHPGLSPTP